MLSTISSDDYAFDKYPNTNDNKGNFINEMKQNSYNILIHINAKDIIYIEALSDYVSIYTAGERFTILSTMKAIENKLDSTDFARIHRSYIIRLDRIKQIEEDIVLVADKELPISRNFIATFLNKLNLI